MRAACSMGGSLSGPGPRGRPPADRRARGPGAAGPPGARPLGRMATVRSPGRRAAAGRRTGWDLKRIRRDFPVLARTVNGKRLVYLDNAATAQKPHPVLDALTRFYTEYNANIHRAVYTLSEEATAAYEGTRANVQGFLGAAERQEIVFVRGTTEAINLVAHSFVRPRLGT